jgi:DNA-directed RNA polymerase subunit H (RpoH/RPB5)
MSTSQKIVSLYKSRQVILDYLSRLQYDISEYENFSMNEVDSMYKIDQSDMLLTHKVTGNKVYIKYSVSKICRPTGIESIVNNLFENEMVLSKQDTLIIILDSEVNDGIINLLKTLYNEKGKFVTVFNIKRLQFNVLNHTLNPDVKIVPDSEIEDLKAKLNIKTVQLLPEISRFDPLALAIILRPGQVIELKRNSVTALTTTYYRVCI